MRQAVFHAAVHPNIVEAGGKFVPEPGAPTAPTPRLLPPLLPAQLTRLAQTHDPRNVQRARPQAALVASAVDERGELDGRVFAADVQRAYALRAVNLVRRNRQQIDAHSLDVDRRLARRLRRVRV